MLMLLLSFAAKFAPLPCFLAGVSESAPERSMVREVLEFKPNSAYSFIFFILNYESSLIMAWLARTGETDEL